MINSVCVSCHQPMNGGVYRKPNQCPHCSTLQDDKRTAANKLISSKADEVGLQRDIAQARLSLDESVQSQKQFISADDDVVGTVDEVFENSGLAVSEREPLAVNILEEQSVEPAELNDVDVSGVDESIVGYDSSTDKAEATLGQDEDFDLYLEEDVESMAVVEVVCFDNVEARPDVDESLDIALNFDDVPVQAVSVVSEPCSATVAVGEEGLDKVAAAKEGIVAANNESNVVSLKEKIGEVRAAKIAAKAEVQEVPFSDAMVSVEVEAKVEAEAVAVGNMKKTQYSVLPGQYESVVLTTETARNLNIEKRLDLVTSECVIGTDAVQSDLSKRKGFSRAEYASSPNALKDARKMVLDEIKKEAFLLGANTVVEVKLEYSEISRGESAMMMVVATGTAVKAKAA